MPQPADLPDDETLAEISESDAAALPAAPATFAELNLSAAVLRSVAAAQFVKPTPIQAQFIPKALSGQDVMGQAKTGTGKTAAFLLPIFEAVKPGAGTPQALILAPTRELALQIHGEIGRLGGGLGFSSITLYGGASYEPQIEALAAGVDIVVGTPGRVMDHMRSHRLDLSRVRIAVLDEADRMLDLGFRKDIEYILRHCPKERQTLLLSATIPEDIRKLAQRFMRNPLEVWTAPESLTVDAVEQHYLVCERENKLPTLLKLLDIEKPALAIIFCGTKIGARKLAERLNRVYISAREIHGDLHQSKRERILGGFRTGKVRLLIATDVASRGLDVQNITHIINYDIPYKIEDYVHRIGRTGRMEKSGKAFTFVTREEGSYLTEIELLINKQIRLVQFEDLTSAWWPTAPSAPPPDFEPDDSEPGLAPSFSSGSRKRRGAGGGGGRSSRDRGREPSRAHEPRRAQEPSRAREQAAGAPPAQATPDAAAPESGAPPRSRHSRSRRRATIPIVCSACGAQAMVSFEPTPGRPVYCDACFQARKSGGAAPAPATEAPA